jgi:hypothetical protein
MTAYAILDDLIAAYVAHYNAGYADPIKHFTPNDVAAVCVTPLVPPDARCKGIAIRRPTTQIAGFGYVAA